jgi:hypothetical protein
MLLNLSNHPSTSWPAKQVCLANELYGEIQDMPFPQIDPMMDEAGIQALASDYLQKILAINPKAVHLMGELTFSFELVQMLKNHGITVISSTTHRTTQDHPDGTKISKFEFVRFRHY